MGSRSRSVAGWVPSSCSSSSCSRSSSVPVVASTSRAVPTSAARTRRPPVRPARTVTGTLVQVVDAVVDDIQTTWDEDIFRPAGATYRDTSVVLFTDRTESGCGVASAETGPFYCPADGLVYLDLGFFRELDRRFGAPGDFAQAYVIAHEIGHHVQTLLGTNAAVQRESQRRTRPNATSSRSGSSSRRTASPACGAHRRTRGTCSSRATSRRRSRRRLRSATTGSSSRRRGGSTPRPSRTGRPSNGRPGSGPASTRATRTPATRSTRHLAMAPSWPLLRAGVPSRPRPVGHRCHAAGGRRGSLRDAAGTGARRGLRHRDERPVARAARVDGHRCRSVGDRDRVRSAEGRLDGERDVRRGGRDATRGARDRRTLRSDPGYRVLPWRAGRSSRRVRARGGPGRPPRGTDVDLRSWAEGMVARLPAHARARDPPALRRGVRDRTRGAWARSPGAAWFYLRRR